ncbi:hypothetical protein [Allomesorhizobium camelthorni]|uniref:Uncharacterized protein n=1 Tax=Allomesorhizobium camelthorni TaxID=475069 RepID=A0A6G4W5E0_9HYPH|nr:hypothetical protein [Mesorhizobium camelthorni]NGO49965.1 hypothetical protein [Mesorhizobium camelthorni]
MAPASILSRKAGCGLEKSGDDLETAIKTNNLQDKRIAGADDRRQAREFIPIVLQTASAIPTAHRIVDKAGSDTVAGAAMAEPASFCTFDHRPGPIL